jgi:hypothetical protein
MINARKELIEYLKGRAKVKCAEIVKGDGFDPEDPPVKFLLKVNHSNEEYNAFLDSLNFKYHNGYGGQELYGTIWLEDNTWLTRGEYDGSEWWEAHELPPIPAYCL